MLHQTCARQVPTGLDPATVETRAWSLIHGFGVVYLSGRFQSGDTSGAGRELFDQVIALLERIGTDPASTAGEAGLDFP
ncbi:hypothetical protein GGR17_000275 [Confluentimicrobium naphthalenivorans]|uniref:Tetracyclin repressor-like C-terminal domain-containing protein n=1 Tax=Actibacterium naphthalenivorans TaxID=1614693 RepID=A0A840C435_9RHOB|nr:hypothetical protein [Actibacterium naphthalenivorans]